ncbi:MAG: hypothetical protein IKR19_03160 [Acholeplasmatales bacterium]|nr:hypothetical protein [Acholeplasmatales bacterium]
MFDLYSALISKYKPGEPILLKDLKYEKTSNDVIRQQLKKLTDKGNINRFDEGVYYFGDDILIDHVIESKYIKKNDEIYGYYSGRNLAIDLGIIDEKPKREIITNNFKAIVRELKLGDETITVRHSDLKIDSKNCYVLRLLDMFKRVSFDDYVNNETRYKLKKYIEKYYIKKSDIDQYIKYFPKKTYKNIYILGINEILMKEEK